jgi:phosphohistidine phosphatase SixA
VQTAELLAGALDFLRAVEVMPSLTPGIPARVAAEMLASREGTVLVVGHEPGLQELGAVLMGRPSFQPHQPAQVSALEGRQPAFALHAHTLTYAPLNLH